MIRFRSVGCGGLLLAAAAANVNAQTVPLGLPTMRALGELPEVARVGETRQVDGTVATAPITPRLAVADLELYDRQLTSLFAMSSPRYPADSITRIRRERAQAWSIRLQEAQHRDGTAMSEREVMAFAVTVMRAGDDTLARHIFEMRLAAAAGNPFEQSYVLSVMVSAFANTDLDSTRLARTVSWAEASATRLHAIAATGYARGNDSTSVLYRNLLAERTLLSAYDVLGAPARVIAHADRFLSVVARLGNGEKSNVLMYNFPYSQVFLAYMAQPNAAKRLTDLTQRLTSFGDAAANYQYQSMLLIGTQAPPLDAHVWLNTPDSLYHNAPVTKTFADGNIHVVVFTSLGSELSSVMEHVKQHFPHGVVPVVMTWSTGHNHLDVATPEEETARLKSYYVDFRHFTVPIGIWAPAKVPVWPGMLPPPPPFAQTYRIEAFRYRQCMVIDGKGTIRAYFDIWTRDREAALMRYLTTMLAEQTAGPPS